MPEYVLRQIPEDLHRAWKSVAALKGLRMREYAIHALKKQIEADMKSFTEDKKDAK